jgi:cyclic pyranopterin phosphate synthase
MLVDGKGRVVRKLRVSVTDRCNFSCLFCMPEKSRLHWIEQQDIISFEEITRLARLLVTLGIESIRVTGGEPLLRKGVESLVGMLSSIDGIKTVDMTTNGWFLEEKAHSLKKAGLRGVTVSLHSLREERFARISGVNALQRVLRGIEAAITAGLDPVKINSVAIRGYNDDEILELVDYAHSRGLSIRFIEFMPLDGLGIWRPEMVMSGREIIEKVSEKFSVRPFGRAAGSTASLWSLGDGPGDIGLITPMSEPFCDDCDRIRLTADGKLLSCLFDTEFHDLRSVMRAGATDEELAAMIVRAVRRKPDGVAYMPWVREGWAKPRSMNAIGG